MEVGLKFFSTNKVTARDYGFADFIEVLPVPGHPVSDFVGLSTRLRVHCPHDQFGFNPSDETIRSRNKMILEETVSAADKLDADIIVIHAGFNSPRLKIKNSKKTAMDFLNEFFDKRFHVENLLPVDNDMVWVGYGPDEIAEFQDQGFKFCLDFGHAIDTATRLGKDRKKYIGEFMKLKPDYFHLSGTINGFDRHSSILDSDIDLDNIKMLIKKSGKPVCLETPLDPEKRKREVALLKA
ncbi:hypothetical protein HYU11_00640 [Candidatus Woesearchaeota archaeon]|nr:hypothetical protein [Candidatus Woesearchaeota archaeon]